MPLPGIGRNFDDRAFAHRLDRLIREFNRVDRKAPIIGTDTGSSTAYAIAPTPGISTYEVGQEFVFTSANANSTTTPTLNVNSKGAGTIKNPDGSALAVGDIPASCLVSVVCTATTPTFALMNVTAANKLLQSVSTVTGAVATGTTTIPMDDTIPQSTEGDQYMSLAITPKRSNSTLRIDVTWIGSASVNSQVTAALFQDSTANALAASASEVITGNQTVIILRFSYVMTSGTTSATTFKVRAGMAGAGTTTFNGRSTARLLGGVMASSIVIHEYMP